MMYVLPIYQYHRSVEGSYFEASSIKFVDIELVYVDVCTTI